MDSALYVVVGIVIAANIFLIAIVISGAIQRKRDEE